MSLPRCEIDEAYEALKIRYNQLRDELEAARDEIEKLTVSRAEIADKQVILRKDLDEAQRYWDKCYRDLLESQSANAALKLQISNALDYIEDPKTVLNKNILWEMLTK